MPFLKFHHLIITNVHENFSYFWGMLQLFHISNHLLFHQFTLTNNL